MKKLPTKKNLIWAAVATVALVGYIAIEKGVVKLGA